MSSKLNLRAVKRNGSYSFVENLEPLTPIPCYLRDNGGVCDYDTQQKERCSVGKLGRICMTKQGLSLK